MSEYFLAPSLVAFRNEINKRFPNRDKSSDGWIGDPSHAARVSSHNPLWSAPGKWRGVVRAIDIDIDDRDGGADLRKMVIKAAVGDRRVWYVISNGIIYSSTYGWAARRYTGSNGHWGHVHISLKETSAAWGDTSRWLDNAPEYKVKPGPVDVRALLKQFKIAAGVEKGTVAESNAVGRIQIALNRQIGAGLTVDGMCGPATLKAWGKWEAKHGGIGSPGSPSSRIPDSVSLTALARGRFSLTNPNWLLNPPKPQPKPGKGQRKVDTIASWNVYVGQNSKGVANGIRTIVKRHDPDVISLQEISGDVAMLRALAKELGYNLLIGPRTGGTNLAKQESQSTGMFVHKDVPIGALLLLQMRLQWIGPKRGLRRPGRTFLTVNANGTQVTALHMPTGRTTTRNRPAWNESMGKLVALAEKPQVKNRPGAFIGDWNVAFNARGTGTAQAFAERVGGKVVADSGRIDFAVVMNANGKGFTGDRLGSDHKYFILKLS